MSSRTEEEHLGVEPRTPGMHGPDAHLRVPCDQAHFFCAEAGAAATGVVADMDDAVRGLLAQPGAGTK